ncbi:MAG: hypothetical protein WCG44_00300 [bacterium]
MKQLLSDPSLITKYRRDFTWLMLGDATLIIIFILMGYPQNNLLPQYLFTQNHLVYIVSGFIFITLSVLSLKYGIKTAISKEMRHNWALDPLYGLSKDITMSGMYIKWRGAKSKIISIAELVVGIVLLIIGIRN